MIRDFVANRTSDSGTKNLRRVGELAMLGDVLDGGDIKAKNDWKANILKAEIERRREAELENRGLIMPTDWDTLSEDVKQERLDGVIAVLREQK